MFGVLRGRCDETHCRWPMVIVLRLPESGDHRLCCDLIAVMNAEDSNKCDLGKQCFLFNYLFAGVCLSYISPSIHAHARTIQFY